MLLSLADGLRAASICAAILTVVPPEDMQRCLLDLLALFDSEQTLETDFLGDGVLDLSDDKVWNWTYFGESRSLER